MAEQLAGTGFQPDVIRSSTAVRAHATAEALSAALGVTLTPVPELYGASAQSLLSHAADTRARAVVLVAHDPGMTDLAEQLSGGSITHMPTAAIATFTWETDDWKVASGSEPHAWDLETPR